MPTTPTPTDKLAPKHGREPRDGAYWDYDLLRSVVNSVPDILFYKDCAGTYLGCNQLFADFVGRPLEAIVGRTDLDLFGHEVAEAFRTRDAVVLSAQSPRHNEEWITYPDGRPALVDTFKAPLRDAEGRLAGLLGISRDITERGRVEQALRESEANFRTFFDTLTDLVVVATPEGRILFANNALRAKLGYSPEDLLSLHLLDLHPAELRQGAVAIFQAMLEGQRASCPLPLLSKAGARLPVETRVWLGTWSGTPCIFGLCKDLSAEQDANLRFERLFRNNPNPMALSSLPDRRFVDVNDAFLRTLGYSSAEILGRTAADLGLFANAREACSVADEIAASGRFCDLEVHARTKDGTVLDGSFSGEVITGQGGNYLLTVLVDVSPYKRVTAALARERERLDDIIEATRVGTWEWHVQTGKTEFNRRWAELLGFSPEELGETTVQTWQALTHPDDLRAATELIERHFAGQTDFYECELRMRHKTGGWVWLLDRGRVCARDGDGRPLVMVGTHQDISERKRAEAEAARLSAIQHELMLLATECINVAVERQDAAINQSLSIIGKLIQADRSYLFEYDFAAGVMNNTHEWCAEGVAPQIQELQQVPLSLFPSWVDAHRRSELVHIPHVDELGRDHPLWQILAPQGIQSLIALPLIAPHGALGFVGFDAVSHARAWDRAEVNLLRVLAEVFANFKMRRRAEEETRRLQEHLERARDDAQAAAKVKSLFLAHMSHEIRTPLNAILGYAQILSRSCDGCPKNQRGIETILTSGEHLLDLLNNILFSARSDSLGLVVEESEFDFHRLLQDVCSVLGEKRRGRPITLSAGWSHDVPQYLLADGGKIRQVLINLAGNAMKFTQRGSVCVQASLEAPADAPSGALRLCITVTDTGCGIAESFLPRLFEPFEQAARDGSCAAGAGLGLPLSRRLARALGGDLRVTSVEGQGSAFQFTFLARAGDGARLSGQSAIQAVAAGEAARRVLVVDDDEPNRAKLHELLRSAGLEVHPASSGLQALDALLQSGPFDVVLMDKRMPGMDGAEAIRRIRATPALSRTPVLLVTASIPSAEAGVLADDVQADGFVYKPLRRSQLLQEIARVTKIRFTYDDDGGRRAARPAPVEAEGPLPPDLAERLRRAAGKGNMHHVRAYVEEIRPTNPRLADRLSAAAAAYDYAALAALAHEEGRPI